MDYLQRLIHALEVGGGMRYFRVGAAVLAIVFLAVLYNWRAFRNFYAQEPMDNAQLARNIAAGKGFTTHFIRPFSIHVLKEKNFHEGRTADAGELKSNAHPDIANAPLYPLFLAGAMSVLPFDYPISDTPKPFWSRLGGFYRYQPDFLISLCNQVLFFASIPLVFLISRKLFDQSIAWISAAVYFGTEIFWRFATSGQSTSLLLLLFLGVVYCLVLLEEETREPRHGLAWPFLICAVTGVLLGSAALTRYSFGWMLVPVLGFLVFTGGPRRWTYGGIVAALFILCLAPWVVRNMSVSGLPFGSATYAVYENIGQFGEYRLQRSLNPDLRLPPLIAIWSKMTANLRGIVTTDFPTLAGSWLTAFFLVGLMIGFRNPGARAMRYFTVLSLAWMAVIQALGQSQLTTASPTINSENLIICLAPLVIIYGVSLFYVLFEQLSLPFREMRFVVMGLFLLLACFPLVLTFLPPRVHPPSWPPYNPKGLQTCCDWLKPDELAMSDIPWASAWYGQRQSVWLTLQLRQDLRQPNVKEDFFIINDFEKPISLLYLSPQIMNSRFVDTFYRGDAHWGSLILATMTRGVPNSFPLRYSQADWMPYEMVLTDSDRRFLKDK